MIHTFLDPLVESQFRIISKSHNFLFGTSTTPTIIFSNSHFFSGQSRHASSPSIVLYLWLGARRPMAGTLGDWKTKLVSFQLKEGASPYHGQVFSLPKIHKDTLIKEVERLVKLGVLKRQPTLEWASPLFIIPKKNRTVRFLSNFGEVNKRLVRKPFPIPKLSMVLQELEGFTFEMALDLNMGYYTIRLDPNASRICTIIFPWGNYSYKRLPMGIAGSPDIFQSKMVELMETLKYVQAYLDDFLCISRSSPEDHLEKLKEVLRHLCNTGLKVNTEKLTFCALEIEYLGYVLTRDGIKPQSNKVQAILAIQPPTNVKELRHLGVQYYRDLSARRSKMLAPLTSFVGECNQTKVTRASQRDQEGALALG
jgi:hypothetical protein